MNMNAISSSSSLQRTQKLRFGYGRYTPSWMQRWNKGPYLLLALSLCSICQGSIVNGFISISISSLEKRFNLTSAQSGLFSAFYDVAIVAMLIPLCHYGKKCHKGRAVATGMLVIGVGSILITLPHFFAGKYTISGRQETALCDANGSGKICTKITPADNGVWYAILLASQLLVGLGAAPLFTLGISYMDENVLQKEVSMYLGAYMAVSTVGPAAGFIAGGQFLKIWGDVGKSNYTDLSLTGPSDPGWYGAWWIGFLIIGVMCFAAAIPVFGFPKELPEKECNREKDIKQTDKGLDKDYGGKISSSLKTLWNMLTNASMASLIMMQSVEAFLMNGFITFIPKVFESLFSYSSSQAATIAGIIIIPMGLLGSLFGAAAARYATRYRATVILAIFFNSCTAVLTLILMYYHQQLPDANVTSAHQPSLPPTTVLRDLPCNVGCNCGSIYNPVCDAINGVSYYSPCYAGCQENVTAADGIEIESWEMCRCVTPGDQWMSDQQPFIQEVTKGLCKKNNSRVVFFVLFSMVCFFAFCSASPIENASLRLVSFGTRDVGICLIWFAMRVLGSIPGAVIFGIVIDQSCVLWKEECGEKQSCLLYDPRSLSRAMFLFAIVLKTFVILLLSISAYSYTPAEDGNNAPKINEEIDTGLNKKEIVPQIQLTGGF